MNTPPLTAAQQPARTSARPATTPAASPLRLTGDASLFLLPLGLALLAIAIRSSGLDLRIADAFFDPATNHFPWRANRLIEMLGHEGIRALATTTWVLLAAATALAALHAPWRSALPLLAATTLAMGLGPLVVVLLKSVTTFPCPWSLARYGGSASEAGAWFTLPARAGRCFPAGHAAGGFSFVALAFGLAVFARPRVAMAALLFALLIGSAASAVRMVQGAHFLSHGLWSASIDWFVAASVFRWMQPEPA